MSELKRAIAASAVDEMRETEPGTVARKYRFAPDFLGFSGHFPGYPVLPALVQVLTAAALAEEAQGHPLRLVRLDNAKFLMQLKPDQELLVQCRQRPKEGELRVEARITVAEGVAASFALTFGEAPR